MNNEWIQEEQRKLLERLKALELKNLEFKKELTELMRDAIRIGQLIKRPEITDDLYIEE
jgi:hypothetical protein